MCVGRRYGDKFRVATVNGCAQEPGTTAKVVLPRQARRALHTTKSRVHDDPVARLESDNAITALGHFARAIPAKDQRRWELPFQAAASVPGIEVQTVERRGFDANLDLAGLDLGLWSFAEGQDFRPAVGFDIDCLHGRVLLGEQANGF